MSIFKNKALLEAKLDEKHKKKIQPVGAWGHYRKQNRPYASVEPKDERKLLIKVSDLGLAYEGRRVISNLSFEIYSGDYVCILGENGSGKTTLMNALLGLKKPCEGSIDLCAIKRCEMGVLPQKTPVQNDFPALVSEIVLSGFAGKKKGIAFYSRRDRKKAFENMEKLGITSIASRSFRELSGGQQQRVLLARALCAAEKLIVLDEPVAGLDPKSCADMYSLLSDINKRENMTVIMVSHDVRGALEHASHILQINKNSLTFCTKDEYLNTTSPCPVCAEKNKEDSALPYGNSDAYKYKGGERNVQD
ncbi:MAG: ABC transporter ATP-binding protein [Ruminococcaceae bacterium]|nr:ABC transporter ATP-binding protein [Oscillospiraceae bacterium]